jgi:hypothetical protein
MSDTSREDFQPIHNPYIVGNPIKDRKMFFGREDDFNYIKQKVTGGKKGGLLVLCGSRRSGKTSILFQIMNERLGEEFLPVLIDMQAMTVENDLDFLIKLAKGIIDTIGDDEISLERHFLAKRSEGSLAAFDSLIDKINERLDGKKLILLFDEYEIFESHIAKNLISTDISLPTGSSTERACLSYLQGRIRSRSAPPSTGATSLVRRSIAGSAF